MPNFICIVESTMAHNHIKLHRDMTSSFQVTGNFLSQKIWNLF